MELWGRRDGATRAKLRGWAWLTCCSHRQSFTVAKLSSVLKLQAVPSPPSREQATAAARDIVINFRFSSVYGTVINPHYAGTYAIFIHTYMRFEPRDTPANPSAGALQVGLAEQS